MHNNTVTMLHHYSEAYSKQRHIFVKIPGTAGLMERAAKIIKNLSEELYAEKVLNRALKLELDAYRRKENPNA